jgi:methyl-accepting chemotaxis protein
MTENIKNLKVAIELQIKDNQAKVDMAMEFAKHYFKSLGKFEKGEDIIRYEAINQVTKASKNVNVRTLYLGGEKIQNNFDFVDKLKSLGIETATIFQKIDGGYLRISTNVISKNGERAVGTYIPSDSPVAQAIDQGNSYKGRAFVVDDWYLAAYEPIKINNEIVGMIYVGSKEKDLKGIKDLFNQKKYYETGYPYIVSEEGDFIIHPKKEGENIANESFFQEMLSHKNGEVNKLSYLWEGREKTQYYTYCESINSFVSATFYDSELFGIIQETYIALIIALLIGIAITILISIFISRSINKTITSVVDETKRLAGEAKAGRLATRSNPEEINIEFREIIVGFNQTLDTVITPLNVAAKYVKEIANGNIPPKITEEYYGDFNEIKNNLNTCIISLEGLNEDVRMLSVAALDGRLSERANDKRHAGIYQKIVHGFNGTLDSVTKPLSVAANYVDRISKGDIPQAITENYNGDFNEIKNNLNLLVSSMNDITSNIKLFAIGDLNIEFKMRSEQDEIMQSLQEMVSATTDIVNKLDLIAKGDLTIQMKTRSEKDVLIQAVLQMVNAVSEVVSQVQIASDNIAEASLEMNSNSQQVSQGASEQASAAEEVSSSMEEMASNIQQNTDNAQQTEKISISAAHGMNQVAASSAESLKSIKEIANKISIIGDIAFQTNILALNAAVEAARAGEHGKGFAVVASEVRKLAENSKVAAEEINQLSKTSVEVTEKAGELMNKIIPEVERTAKLVQEITAASIEQNSGANQINNAINQLNQVTQQNAAAAEEMATSSEELNGQADQLRELVSFFIVNNHNSSSVVKKKKIASKTTQISSSQHKMNTPTNSKNGVHINLHSNDKRDADFEQF